MNTQKVLSFYLEEPMKTNALSGRVNIINRISKAFESHGFETIIRGNSDLEVLSSQNDPGYSLFHMEHPFHPRALTLRKAYYYPFWRIEASSRRWEWAAATARFDPGKISDAEAQRFTNYWRKELFGKRPGADTARHHILIPLQGRLAEKRGFQSMSPLEMVEATLQANPNVPVITTLHPRENYSHEELELLSETLARHDRLELNSKPSENLVRQCSMIVTQTSSMALAGYFHHKPVVLFGKIDFHHIAAKVSEHGVGAAFELARNKPREYDKYLFWFLQQQSINAGRDDAEDKIIKTVRRLGWNV